MRRGWWSRAGKPRAWRPEAGLFAVIFAFVAKFAKVLILAGAGLVAVAVKFFRRDKTA